MSLRGGIIALSVAGVLSACATEPEQPLPLPAQVSAPGASGAMPAALPDREVAGRAEVAPRPAEKSVASKTSVATVAVAKFEPAAPRIGTVTGFRSSTVTLYPQEASIDGSVVVASAFKLPLDVVAQSDSNLRLKVRTSEGERWIAPTDVEYSGTFSRGAPAVRATKHSAGGRGID